jgi:hypothetical protein
MGKGDRRHSLKMRRRQRHRKLKERSGRRRIPEAPTEATKAPATTEPPPEE